MLRDFIQTRYVPYIREHKRSWQTDVRYLNRHVLPYLGACRLSEIDSATLYRWREELLASGLSQNTCYRLFWLVKYILNCAVRWQVLSSDAAFCDATCPRVAPRCPESLSAEEVERLIELLVRHGKNPSARAIHLLLLTGASKSEILYARWEDVDLRRGVLVTRRTPSGEAQDIPLSEDAVRLIRALPRRIGVPWLFFRASTGERVVSVFSFWNKMRRELGKPSLRLNDLRHAFARTLLEKGASYREIRSRLGHYSSEAFLLQAGRPCEPSEHAQGVSGEQISFS